MVTRGKPRSVRPSEKDPDRDTRALDLKKMRQLIKSLRGCCKGEDSLVDDLHRGRHEESFAERRWGK